MSQPAISEPGRRGERLATVRDFRPLARELVGYGLAGLAPRSLDRWMARAVASRSPKIKARTAEAMEVILGRRLREREPSALADEYEHRLGEERWGRWRAAHRRGWDARFDIRGREHLEAALSEGQGAVLWGTSFCGTVAVKVGLHRAGIDVVHLSGSYHGVPSPPTKVGRKLVAPLAVRAESRHVGERVLVGPRASSYLRLLKQRLSENRSLWIYGENAPGLHPATAPLFGRDRVFPTGAPSLAYSSGAALLVVHVERLGFFHYRILVEEAFETDRAAGKRSWIETAVLHFARRLEDEVSRHPVDWDWGGGWVKRQLAAEPVARRASVSTRS